MGKKQPGLSAVKNCGSLPALPRWVRANWGTGLPRPLTTMLDLNNPCAALSALPATLPRRRCGSAESLDFSFRGNCGYESDFDYRG
jgi:hypothetical protein